MTPNLPEYDWIVVNSGFISLVQIQAKLQAGHVPGPVTAWMDCAA